MRIKITASAWTWAIQGCNGKWMLCLWSVPSRSELLKEGKPSPEAKPIHVIISGEMKK
jgi:hypothetical protein